MFYLPLPLDSSQYNHLKISIDLQNLFFTTKLVQRTAQLKYIYFAFKNSNTNKLILNMFWPRDLRFWNRHSVLKDLWPKQRVAEIFNKHKGIEKILLLKSGVSWLLKLRR